MKLMEGRFDWVLGGLGSGRLSGIGFVYRFPICLFDLVGYRRLSSVRLAPSTYTP